ncbi:PH domain-containing protein [Shewanella frigidimarina]|jgi:hypothetical protein|uniref:PH domain-containing protein n=1 Tax=Shewanella frigidimarina TaxID=56812 RepID=UPI003D7C1021
MEPYSTSKVWRSAEAFIEIILKLVGVYLTYLIFNKLGQGLLDADFSSETLFSLLMLPSLYILKSADTVISPWFVMVNISDTEVEARTGVLTQRLDKLNLKNVENIEIISTLGGRIFGYSSIYLYAYGSWVLLPFITNCDQVKASLESKINGLRAS